MCVFVRTVDSLVSKADNCCTGWSQVWLKVHEDVLKVHGEIHDQKEDNIFSLCRVNFVSRRYDVIIEYVFGKSFVDCLKRVLHVY